MRKILTSLFLTLAVCTVSTDPGLAQQQNRDQQKCLTAIAKRAAKLSGVVVKEGAKCVSKAAKGKLDGVAQACLDDDGNKKRVKGRAKVGKEFLKSCGTLPDFGLEDETTVNDAHADEAEGLLSDLFAGDLDAAVISGGAIEPSGKCATEGPKTLTKIAGQMHKQFGRCLKSGLRDGSVTSDVGVLTCLQSIKDDVKGRIAKQVTKLSEKLVKRCPGGNIDPIFTGMTDICSRYSLSTDALGMAQCQGLRLACRVCRTVELAHGIERDCDDYDDGMTNGSCPKCPNGVLDSGEECDDDNTVDGDGCTALCRNEVCGDGIVNNGGAEECDDGASNSDGTPDACRTDCTLPVCGDGVLDPSNAEECDDGNSNDSDGCTNACTTCGNGAVTAPEQCDDGGIDNGDCCAADCSFEMAGLSCPGTPADCTTPQCDGAGMCADVAANEGGTCDDGDECTKNSTCTAGSCDGSGSLVITGEACRWSVVGSSEDDTIVRAGPSSELDGPWCGQEGDFLLNSTITGNGDLVLVGADGGNVAAVFAPGVNADSGDIVTDNGIVNGAGGTPLPGIDPLNNVPAGTFLAKMPAPTFYDTTGTDPRIADCTSAQASLAALKAQLNAATADDDFGDDYKNMAGGDPGLPLIVSFPPDPSVVTSGLNVFDVSEITAFAGNDLTIQVDGNGLSDSVIIIRSAGKVDTAIRWTIETVNGLTPDRLLVYSQFSGSGVGCKLTQDSFLEGTLFCPDTRTEVKLGSSVTGAVFGGAGGAQGRVEFGEDTTLFHEPFTGF